MRDSIGEINMKKLAQQQKLVEECFTEISKELDISDTRFEEAVAKYNSLGNWLGRENSAVRELSPVIYPQGSFSLGTVIKPISDEEDYDIDLVCLVDLSSSTISQKKLKELIGLEIISYAKANNMHNGAKEGKRCWAIEYAEGAQFHMDILPSIPSNIPVPVHDPVVSDSLPNTAISITDNTCSTYSMLNHHWPQSNPKKYLAWFKGCMEKQLRHKIAMFSESRGIEIDEVPEHKVKTTLQRAIQLLKRHRDIMFVGKPDKPISIIISTLAAHAYLGEDTVSAALENIVLHMEQYFVVKNGKHVLPNPVNSSEYFTDRWEPEDEKDFFRWLDEVKTAFTQTIEFSEGACLESSMSRAFGEKVAHKVMQPKNVKLLNVKEITPPNIIIDTPARPWKNNP